MNALGVLRAEKRVACPQGVHPRKDHGRDLLRLHLGQTRDTRPETPDWNAALPVALSRREMLDNSVVQFLQKGRLSHGATCSVLTGKLQFEPDKVVATGKSNRTRLS